MGGRVIAVSLVVGAGFPREVPREGDGSFVLRPGLGIVIIEARYRWGAGVVGFADAWLLAPSPGSCFPVGLGSRQVSSEGA